MIEEDTYSEGDQEIWIEGDGRYSGPLARYVDDWDAIFEYATGTTKPTSGDSSESDPESDDGPVSDTAGRISETRRSHVQLSEGFKREVYDRFNSQSPLSGIEHPAILTISHILDRAEYPELAEDIENVVLLDWNLHMALDAGLWTFDESGRVWVNPEFEAEGDALKPSLVDRHGEKIEAFSNVSDEYIERHNSELEWWPPR